MNQYMIVPQGSLANWNKYSETEQKGICERYYQWTQNLRAEDRLIASSRLSPEHRNLRSIEGKVAIDGPFPETKEILTSYFVVQAKSFDEAVEVSKGCPALTHGDWVQVFEVSGGRQ